MLANIRGMFSEALLGQIASQVMVQLHYLHQCQVVYKYLTPQNLVILQGF